MVFYIAYRSTVYELRTTFPCPIAPRDLKHIDRALNEGSHFTTRALSNVLLGRVITIFEGIVSSFTVDLIS